MAKKKEPEVKPLEIIGANIKDDFCNYEYLILEGVGKNDKVNVKGTGIILDDMRDAFSAFNVHLACIDDVFKHSGTEIESINKLRSHELTQLFHVTGFKVKGSTENQTVILIGSKYVSSSGGRIEIETPRIPLDSTSSYAWHKELKKAVDAACQEVEEYKAGKYTIVQDDPDQGEHLPKIDFSANVNDDADFNKNKV